MNLESTNHESHDPRLYKSTTPLEIYQLVCGWDLCELTGTANKRQTTSRRHNLLRDYLSTMNQAKTYLPLDALLGVAAISSFAKTLSSDQTARLQALFHSVCTSLAWRCKDPDKGRISTLQAFLKNVASKNNNKLKVELRERKEVKPLFSRAAIQTAALDTELGPRWDAVVRLAESYFHQVALPEKEALAALLKLKQSDTKAAIKHFLVHVANDDNADDENDLPGEDEMPDPTSLRAWSERHPRHGHIRRFADIFLCLPRFPKTIFDEALGLLFFSLHNIPKPEVCLSTS
jgi:hypothetical protein